MKNWIKTHKQVFVSICCFAYILTTGIPILFSYGLLVDIRPVIIVTDVLALIVGVVNLIEGTM